MARIIHKLLLSWVLLLGACILTQVLPLPGSARLGYALLLVVAFTSPVVLVLLLLFVVLGLRGAGHRLRVLWRARKWKRAPRVPWPGQEWDE